MTTKEQERKALEQIRKIVDSLGECSYVGTAFAGCFEDAEDNIENDFAMSMKDRYEHAERECTKLSDECMNLRKENARLREDATTADGNYRKLAEQEKLSTETMLKECERANKLAAKCEAQRQEIIELKARLYDLLCK